LRCLAGSKKPVLIGTKVPVTYLKGDNFFEINIMCDQNNSIAKTAIKMSYGVCNKLVVDLGFILQAEEQEELPEILTGCIRLDRIDIAHDPWKM